MNCNEFQNAIDEAVESRTVLSAEVISHVQSCSSSKCQERLAEHRLLESAILQWKSKLPVTDLVDQIVAEVSQPPVAHVGQISRRTGSRPAKQQTFAVVLTVAVCLIIGLVGILVSQSGDLQYLAESSESATYAPEDDPNQIDDESFDLDAISEFGEAYGMWVQKSAQNLKGSMTGLISDGETSLVGSTKNWLFSLGEQVDTLDAEFDQTLEFLVPVKMEQPDDQSSIQDRQGNKRIL